MNVFWLLALLITSVGGLFLFFFFVSFLFPRGTKVASKISQIIFKMWIPILACSGIYALLIVQEWGALRHSSQRYYEARSSGNEEFFFAAERFKVQRNLYILILGIVILFGLLIISWQVHFWTKRNLGLSAQLHHD